MDKDLREFCENYDVKIVNDSGRHARFRPPTFFSDPENAAIIRDDIIEYQTEKLYTLQIPESRLKTLVEMENRFFNFRKADHPRDLFDILMEKEREESYFRQTNQAVKTAYEQYSMLLNLAGYRRKI